MNTLIVGAGKAGTRIAEIINSVKPIPYTVIGFIDDDPEKIGNEIQGYPVLGGSDHFFEFVEKYEASQIIMSISHRLEPKLFEALTLAEEKGLIVTSMPAVYEELLGRVPIFLLETDWLLRSFYDQAHASAFYEMIKRMVDIFGALIGTLILCIVFPFIALAIIIDSGFPVFYSQERLGLRGSTFNILKFRTMIKNAEEDGIARPACAKDKRITHIGNFLRRSHLDEMPQFINVLRGDLSLIGVIIAGSIGSLLAAALLYWIGRKIPQHHLFTLVERYGKYLRISVADLEKSLAWFEKYGHRIVFFGRMVPAVRSLISIPAGMSKMPFSKFMAYSAFGTIIWTTFLAFLGYHLSEDQALMSLIMQRASYIILAIVILYIIWKMAKKFGQKT